HLFRRSRRAVSRRHREAQQVARIVEVDELLQAFDVAIVEELLLEVRSGRLGGRTLWRCHAHVARRRHLELAVDIRGLRYPRRVRVGTGTETASEESSHSQVPVAEA